MEHPSFADWLGAEFHSRQAKNPRYSLRAFARHLGVSSGRLTEVLNRKRRLTTEHAWKAAQNLRLEPDRLQELRDLLDEEARRQQILKPFGPPASIPARRLSDREFESISDPFYYALLALFESDAFQGEPEWIAKKLGCPLRRVRTALLRLEGLELVCKDPRGRWRLHSSWVTTPTDRFSLALQEHHRAKLRHASRSIKAVSIEARDLSSITMCIDPSRIPLAKELIREFRFKLCDLLTSGSQSEVYHLNIQLVPQNLGEKETES